MPTALYRAFEHLRQDDGWMNVVPRFPHPRLDANRHSAPLHLSHEPGVFDGDELLDPQPEDATKYSYENTSNDDRSIGTVEIETYTEVSAVVRSASHSNFNILLHLKAHVNCGEECYSKDQANPLLIPQNSRAPKDLVTVLDVSGSMAGTKLALLKRAMGFVIQNLGPSDQSTKSNLENTPSTQSQAKSELKFTQGEACMQSFILTQKTKVTKSNKAKGQRRKRQKRKSKTKQMIITIFKSWQSRVQLAQLSTLVGNPKNFVPPPVPRPSDMFYGKIIPALKEKGIRRVISRRDWPHEVEHKVFLDLTKESPRQLLHQELW
ncbi:hypothetical protein POM88_007655 [Heracleum sosnowskyi]|uniref:Uncharacterized protein n=1 Tax=Heracleum sosnowskyi TaxID=360622 RepID=A0AAD8J509_9APIA|nr:hypothetical protein POM88_007655 [Heracleum sosnowskyi]